MKKLSSLIMCIMLVMLTMLSSCSSENLLVGIDDEVTVTFNCDTPRSWDIAKYVVTATDTSGNVKSSESATATLSITLKKGVWNFVVSAYDTTSTELYKGSKSDVDLTSGTATSFNVMIIKRAGSVSIDISSYKAAGSSSSGIKVVASKSGFDDVEQTATTFTEKVVFSDLAQGTWTFTVSVGGNAVGTLSGNVTASALISLVGNYSTTTTTSSTTTTTVIPGPTTTTIPQPVTGAYYWTNKDNHYGTNKTISSWSDWTTAEQIAQCSGYDDPRTWRGHQETPYDVYALYAAYDDDNLYIMTELVNLADDRATFMNHSYAGSDNAWWDNRDCPLGFIVNTGKGKTATGPVMDAAGSVIWGAINFTDSCGFDYLLYASSKYGFADHKSSFVGVGVPGLFKLNKTTGYFSYDPEYCLSVNKSNTASSSGTAGTSGVTIRYTRKCQVSQTIYFESTPTDNRGTSEQTGADLMASSTFSSASTNDLDMSYWYTIPLSTLGIDKAYIQSTGIGIRQITPNGGSLMDCCPWDVSMVDNAGEACSDDESTSHEKEDKDAITSGQARVGK